MKMSLDPPWIWHLLPSCFLSGCVLSPCWFPCVPEAWKWQLTFAVAVPQQESPSEPVALYPFGVGGWFQHLLLVLRKFRLRTVLLPIHYHLQGVCCSCKRTNISYSQLYKTFIWCHKHEWKMNLHRFCFCLCCLCLHPQKVGYNLHSLFWGLCNFVATVYKLVPLKKRWFMRIWR